MSITTSGCEKHSKYFKQHGTFNVRGVAFRVSNCFLPLGASNSNTMVNPPWCHRAHAVTLKSKLGGERRCPGREPCSLNNRGRYLPRQSLSRQWRRATLERDAPGNPCNHCPSVSPLHIPQTARRDPTAAVTCRRKGQGEAKERKIIRTTTTSVRIPEVPPE